MSREITTKNGKSVVLLNPAEKSKRYSRQMKAGNLSLTQLTYRSGYLNARRDNAKAFCHNKGIKYKGKK